MAGSTSTDRINRSRFIARNQRGASSLKPLETQESLEQPLMTVNQRIKDVDFK
jgi:hypothetical protein